MTPHVNPSDAEIHDLLARRLTVAVVGCSPDPTRESHRVAATLQRRGHRIVPVHSTATEVLGEPVVHTLRDVAVPVDMVDVFRRPEAVPAVVEDAIGIGAGVLWLQLGVVHEEAAARARAAGLMVVMDRCPAIEYRRLFPE